MADFERIWSALPPDVVRRLEEAGITKDNKGMIAYLVDTIDE